MIEQHTLSNGVRVILYNEPHCHSVSIGIFELVSLAQEHAAINGISHFLEHMSFKGTPKRKAKQIAEFVDNIGGRVNAHTTKEYTCYYLTVLPHHIYKGLDLLQDIVLNSKLDSSDIEMEKQVILEEINMYEDTPDEKIHDIFSQTILNNNKLGWPIIGTEESLKNINQAELQAFKQHYFIPENVIISVAGNITNQGRLFNHIESQFSVCTNAAPGISHYLEDLSFASAVAMSHKKSEQIHFCLGGKSTPYAHPDHYKLSLLNTILGGAMSSRLFQRIREQKGYAYCVYSYISFYKQSGLYTIYGGINKHKFKETLAIVCQELTKMKDKKVAAKELIKAKENIKGHLILSLEKTSNWMNWLGRSILYLNDYETLEKTLAEIDAVTVADIQEMAINLFDPLHMSLAVTGPIQKSHLITNPTSLTEYLSHLSISFK